jgi:RNA recognition motif-containing protein
MQQASDHHPFEGPSKFMTMNVPKPKDSRNGAWSILPGSDAYHASSDASLFTSSLPVLPHEKLNLNEIKNNKLVEDDVNDLLEEVAHHAIGSLLPGDEDELLAGIMEGFDLSGIPNRAADDMEDYDFFGSGGGLELESDPQDNLGMGVSNLNLSDGSVVNGVAHYSIPNGIGTVAGEHPYGEHPSRTLFVRNINSNVEESELQALFEQYGDIRTLYTACKHRGFVMISYYDIRAARSAMRALQNKPIRRRKLDIHFSIPKDNPSDKDINQGTLVVFNLDPSVSTEDLRQIFGAYGEVKEIRETPHKRHHKFIEYYDVRAAEAALRALNRSDIAGKRIKLEPSRPGGARRNLMLQLNQELEQDETRSFLHQVSSSIGNSPPGNWPQFGSPIERNLQTLSKSPVLASLSPTMGSSNSPGLASILHSQSPARIAPIGKDSHTRNNNMDHIFPNGNLSNGLAFQHSHSLPDAKLSQYPPTISSFGASSSNGSAIETLSVPQFLWGSPKPNNTSATWRAPTAAPSYPFASNGQRQNFLFTSRPGSFTVPSQNHHHVGSAPPGGHLGFYQESPETLYMNSAATASFGGGGLSHGSERSFMGPRGIGENGSVGFGMMSSSPRVSQIFHGNGQYSLGPSSFDGLIDRSRTRRVDPSGTQIDSKKQFQLDLDKILSGEDARTTLMIKNIPNKYTSKMLLAAIDESHKGTYDFLYLPIDFKNKCNVGYAFINMLSPSHIIPFYQAFNGKKWEKFNSEKVASLAYARIQGKIALVTHFQNSSLMNEDKRCRPILFHSDGSEATDQERLPSNNFNIQTFWSNGADLGDTPGSPIKDGTEEKNKNSSPEQC